MQALLCAFFRIFPSLSLSLLCRSFSELCDPINYASHDIFPFLIRFSESRRRRCIPRRVLCEFFCRIGNCFTRDSSPLSLSLRVREHTHTLTATSTRSDHTIHLVSIKLESFFCPHHSSECCVWPQSRNLWINKLNKWKRMTVNRYRFDARRCGCCWRAASPQYWCEMQHGAIVSCSVAILFGRFHTINRERAVCILLPIRFESSAVCSQAAGTFSQTTCKAFPSAFSHPR